LAPIVSIISSVTLGIIYFMYRNKLKTTPEQIEKLMALNEKDYIQEQSLLLTSISILELTFLGFLLHSIIHVDASVIALTGATLILLIG
ncbi:hypothetical protein FO503_31905, partial [Bacillus cereus]|nr:hypothetical protein [Bacillus cereus]